MKKLIGLIATLLMFAATTVVAGEVDSYIKIFQSGSPTEQEKACKRLEFAGLNDTRIFDLVEKNLLAGYQTANSRTTVGEMAWFTKALAFSGQEKYRKTIQEVVDNGGHKKLRKYASQSLELLDKYKRWQPILSAKGKGKGNKAKSEKVNRYARMLDSDEFELNTLAAKRIINEDLQDPYLLDKVMKQAKKRITQDESSKEYVDATAYMLKALAVSRKEKYMAVVEDAAENASNRKVKKYAAKYLKQYR